MPELMLARQGWADALKKLGEINKNVVVMDADLAKSTLTVQFQEKYPDRFYDMGIAEQDMLGTAAGLSLAGKIPFVATYGVFVAGRAWDQIRTTICYSNLNVKIAGAHGGISVGPDGATHQALEEIATMRVLPKMTVIAPADYYETKKAVLAMAEWTGPCYVRFGREKSPVVTAENTPFEIGKANIMKAGNDVAIIACGTMVYEALTAAKKLEAEGIQARVINLHTIKPLDVQAVLEAAQTGAIVTAEEHQIAGGLGSTIAEVVVQNSPVPMEFVGVKDSFGESGRPDELMKAYGLSTEKIYEAVQKVLVKKKKEPNVLNSASVAAVL